MINHANRFIHNTFQRAVLHRRMRKIRRHLLSTSRPYALNIGCGKNRFAGWINVDLENVPGVTDWVWDVTFGIPLENACCNLIYSEHFLEHLSVEQGEGFLRECHRALRPGGTVRIAMPSLDNLIEKLCHGNWRDQEWLTWPEYQFVQTRAEMLNLFFYWWGHQWLYDREELYRRLRQSGFQHIINVEWGQSHVPGLQNRETRLDSLLIVEAQKN